jgi:hypothetical protein
MIPEFIYGEFILTDLNSFREKCFSIYVIYQSGEISVNTMILQSYLYDYASQYLKGSICKN